MDDCTRSACTTLLAIFLALAVADTAGAQANGNYILGQRGIKGATVPPEGFLLQQDFFWYTADLLKDDNGDTLPTSGELDIYTGATTVTWSHGGWHAIFNPADVWRYCGQTHQRAAASLGSKIWPR